ncbi:hypothetical protein ETB97_009355 [Aspergillus alliaceus]|uniref:H-type lectin domain-containing protein n=1 Tax=Petromyces alliaceus TaxID=209559 RepID=A0A8H5ZUG1_PETAA|nr:hypothetical protein ETB97_009355 [Aspergillus burnettii]
MTKDVKICLELLPPGDDSTLPQGNLRPPALGSGPPELAMDRSAYWRPGIQLHVRFLSGDTFVKGKVMYFAQIWEKYARIDFIFDDSPKAELRVDFTKGAGSWSYLGRHNLQIAPDKPTMNFGWFDDNTTDEEFSRTTLHEFGHALGLIHEHMSPTANIPWDRKKVYDYFGGPPNNWTKEMVDRNLFERYPPSGANYSSFDPYSIMLYRIPNELTIGDFETPNNIVLSATDKSFVGILYPKQTRDVGRFSTKASRNDNTPGALNSMVVAFESAYPEPPSVAVGLTELDLSKDTNIRVKAYAERITKDDFVVHTDAWADTVLYSAGAAWFEVSSTDTEFQIGEFNTLDLHPWNDPSRQNTKRVIFERSYPEPPKVVIWLQGLDMDKNKDWRIAAHASNITTEGFDLHIDTWDDSKLYSGTASWIAYPGTKTGIASGAVDSSTPSGLSGQSESQKKGGRVAFPQGTFDRVPEVTLALKSFNFGNQHNLRLEAKAENVTKDGFNWSVEGLGDSDIKGAGVSYLAI